MRHAGPLGDLPYGRPLPLRAGGRPRAGGLPGGPTGLPRRQRTPRLLAQKLQQVRAGCLRGQPVGTGEGRDPWREVVEAYQVPGGGFGDERARTGRVGTVFQQVDDGARHGGDGQSVDDGDVLGVRVPPVQHDRLVTGGTA
ncbi:hypothetical protein [Streptomyces resistomycificus]|uniref:hypothetical protein n=1 Tax=Streptomyces resistomycificus TaxID=67356 RepID=UPI00069CE296|nr:hypothetical protein [Streptomyces resistomycificus]